MRPFKDAEHAIRIAAWNAIDRAVPFAVTYTAHGFKVVELSEVKKKETIAEVVHDLAETIRFSDYEPAHQGGAEGRARESARRDEAARKITCGDSL